MERKLKTIVWYKLIVKFIFARTTRNTRKRHTLEHFLQCWAVITAKHRIKAFLSIVLIAIVPLHSEFLGTTVYKCLHTCCSYSCAFTHSPQHAHHKTRTRRISQHLRNMLHMTHHLQTAVHEAGIPNIW